MGYRIEFSRQAQKDAKLLESAGLDDKTKALLRALRNDPFTLPYEKLKGGLRGAYSRRINRQHRLVYTVSVENRLIVVLQMWRHYE